MKRNIIERIVIFTAGLSSVTLAERDTSQKRDTRTLDAIRSTHQLPGLAALAIYANGTLATGAAGERKAGNTIALTTEDKFHLGSNTKAMTATLLAKIIEKDSTLTWNTTLSSALPNITNLSSEFKNVTLAQVASHRSGIATDVVQRDLQYWLSLFDPAYNPVQGRREIAELFLLQRPDVTPNTSYNYSNVNYIILGHIIDNFGIAWEERIRTDLWEPLNMTGCGLGPSPNSSPEAIDNPWAHNHTSAGPIPIPPLSGNTPTDNPRTIGPAGTVHCSMDSYSRFLWLHLSGLIGTSTPYLSSSTLTFLHEPLVVDTVPNSVNIMTSGGWVYLVDSSSMVKYGSGALYHAGSNSLNYAITVISSRDNVATAAFTNVGGDQAILGCTEVIDDILAQDIVLRGTGRGGSASSVGETIVTKLWWVVFACTLSFFII
ncbi:hypothetical protein VTL71DRAFT_6445 [Oculimacula yallundae]|uniref:Beta-lactamase-related domain-containing protein n=1 Tax=Oculimacula yallundae TaxID=86028 RepID=A0ABR4BYP5_9HELO